MRYIIFLLPLFLCGCIFDKYHAYDFKASSNADCAVKCESIMHNLTCLEGQPSFSIGTQQINGGETKVLNNECSCYVTGCWK